MNFSKDFEKNIVFFKLMNDFFEQTLSLENDRLFN